MVGYETGCILHLVSFPRHACTHVEDTHNAKQDIGEVFELKSIQTNGHLRNTGKRVLAAYQLIAVSIWLYVKQSHSQSRTQVEGPSCEEWMLMTLRSGPRSVVNLAIVLR